MIAGFSAYCSRTQFQKSSSEAAASGERLFKRGRNQNTLESEHASTLLSAYQAFVDADGLAYVASPDGCASQTAATQPTGPYAVKGCSLPATVPQAVKDMQAYIDAGKSNLALEFPSPAKGPALEQICVEVGSGIRTAEAGAKLYDEDVKKQAQQLGLPGW